MSTAQSIPQAFCLKLNSHQAHVIDQFQKLYNEEKFCDCTLSCNEGNIKAHKIVLSACSPYFQSLFLQCTEPYQYPVIILKDMSLSDLKVLVEFMYKGEITVLQSNLPSLLESAKLLQITGLREVKIANQETKPNDSSCKSPKRRKRKHKLSDGNSTMDSDNVSEQSGQSDNEDNNLKTSDNQLMDAQSNDELTENFMHEQLVIDSEYVSELDHHHHHDQSKSLIKSSPQKNLNNSSSSSCNLTSHAPVQTHKQNLRQLRIEKTAAATGNLSGRKMWTEEETKSLVRIWGEESERVWASAGKKVLSLQRISDLLIQENIDRDVSQVEGKIKALKRDYKQIKFDKAIPAVQQRMAPYLEKLDKIFSKEDQ